MTEGNQSAHEVLFSSRRNMPKEVIKPKEIYEYLRTLVIGQDGPLRDIATALYKHLINHKVGNVIMIGNSGTGKTTIMRTIEAFFVHHPEYGSFSTTVRINANLLADLSRGGTQSSVILEKLQLESLRILGRDATLDKMVERIENGIVCIDEVDKIRASMGGEPNVKGIIAQDSLLTLMENDSILFSVQWMDNGELRQQIMPINTNNILFIAAGAFEELYEMVFTRVTGPKSKRPLKAMLVQREDGTLRRQIIFRLGEHLLHEDMFRYGMVPQFISRFESIVILDDLNTDALVTIFKDLPNSIYTLSQTYFASVGVTLQVPERIMRIIADRASMNNRIGARALKETFYRIIRNYEFDPFSSGLVKKTPQGNVLEITEDVVRRYLGEAA